MVKYPYYVTVNVHVSQTFCILTYLSYIMGISSKRISYEFVSKFDRVYSCIPKYFVSKFVFWNNFVLVCMCYILTLTYLCC